MTEGSRTHGGPAEEARTAAFALQVELSTRIGLSLLRDAEGILSEAFASLESVQATAMQTRAELSGALESAAQGTGDLAERVRDRARALSDDVLGPFLDRWRPRFAALEEQRPTGRTLVDHETAWQDADAFRAALRELAEPLHAINTALADITGADLEPPRGNAAAV
ncbi:hypothetical protein [Nocardiopsis coralliicola]